MESQDRFRMDRKSKLDPSRVDTKEFEIPETVFVRDIDNKVFQSIVLQVLSKIHGITLVEGNLIDNLLGRATVENVKGINAEQDSRHNTISVRVEVNIFYGLSIPEKAEEIQGKVADEISKLTGLHVSCVHVVFKNMIPPQATKNLPRQPVATADVLDEEYTDEF